MFGLSQTLRLGPGRCTGLFSVHGPIFGARAHVRCAVHGPIFGERAYFGCGARAYFRCGARAWCGARAYICLIRVRGVPARDISPLRAFAPGGGPILRDVRAACALLEIFREKCNLAYTKRYFSEEVCVWLKPDARFSKKRVFGLSQTLRFGEGARNI